MEGPKKKNIGNLIKHLVDKAEELQIKKENTMNIYVGNLSRNITEDDLKVAFEAFGQLTSVNVIKDKYSGDPRGFGFVEMPSKDEAQSAIDGLNGTELKGQSINVNEARSRTEKRGNEATRGGGRSF